MGNMGFIYEVQRKNRKKTDPGRENSRGVLSPGGTCMDT